MKKSYSSRLPPRFRDFLVKEYIGGWKIYYSYDLKTRYELMKDATQKFNLDMIMRYGSRANFERVFAKERGFKTYMDYRKWLLGIMGFKGFTEYNNYLAKTGGFKSQYDKIKAQIKKRKFKSFYEYYKFLAEKKGKSVREYTGNDWKPIGVICLCGKAVERKWATKYCSRKCHILFNGRMFRAKMTEEQKKKHRDYCKKYYQKWKNKLKT